MNPLSVDEVVFLDNDFEPRQGEGASAVYVASTQLVKDARMKRADFGNPQAAGSVGLTPTVPKQTPSRSRFLRRPPTHLSSSDAKARLTQCNVQQPRCPHSQHLSEEVLPVTARGEAQRCQSRYRFLPQSGGHSESAEEAPPLVQKRGQEPRSGNHTPPQQFPLRHAPLVEQTPVDEEGQVSCLSGPAGAALRRMRKAAAFDEARRAEFEEFQPRVLSVKFFKKKLMDVISKVAARSTAIAQWPVRTYRHARDAQLPNRAQPNLLALSVRKLRSLSCLRALHGLHNDVPTTEIDVEQAPGQLAIFPEVAVDSGRRAFSYA